MSNNIYFIFAGDDYYPGGGAWDFKGVKPTLEEAQQRGDELAKIWDWVHIAEFNEDRFTRMWRRIWRRSRPAEWIVEEDCQ